MVQFLSIIFFSWISSIYVGFSKFPVSFVSLCISIFSVRHSLENKRVFLELYIVLFIVISMSVVTVI